MIMYIGADHRGFALKEEIIKYLQRKKIVVRDVGAFEYDKKDDYVDFAIPVAQAVASSKGKARGILLCGSGIGVCMTANKVADVRAANVWASRIVKSAQADDNVNVLCLPADEVTPAEAKRYIRIWLETKASSAERHKRRLKKLKKFEKTL